MPKLLIIDDDPLILRSLKRAYGHIAPDWDVDTLDDASQLLVYLASKGRPDVLITDQLMPKLSGEKVLELSRRHSPATLRCLLTANNRVDFSVQLRDLCHLYLAKPFTQVQIKEVVVCAERLKDLELNTSAREALGRLRDVPAMSPFIRDLQRLLGNPDCDLKQVVELVEQDPLLAGKVLQLANSAYLGYSQPAPSLHQALARLGLNMLRAVLVNDELTRHFSTCIESDRLNEISSRAFNTARRAKTLSELAGDKRAQQEMVFIVVLLAALGDMAGLFYRNQFVDLLPGDVLCAYILTLWGSPSEVCKAILLPDSPQRCKGRLQTIHYLARYCDKNLSASDEPELEGLLEQSGLTDAYRLWRETAHRAETI